MQEIKFLRERVAVLEKKVGVEDSPKSSPSKKEVDKEAKSAETCVKNFCKNIAKCAEEYHLFRKDTLNKVLEHCAKYPENKIFLVQTYEDLCLHILGESTKDSSYDIIVAKMSKLVSLPKNDVERRAKIQEILT
jgi:hypothetical protein